MSISSCKKINEDEFVSISIFEIVSHTYAGNSSDINIQLHSLNESFKSFVSEIHQLQYAIYSNNKISLELTWLTQDSSNQVYTADIRIFLTFRILGLNEDQSIIPIIFKRFERKFYGYTLKEVKLNEFVDIYNRYYNDKSSLFLLRKRESLVSLQEEYISNCVVFKKINSFDRNFSDLLNILRESPNCLVSFQIIPTTYSQDEINKLEEFSTVSNVLQQSALGDIITDSYKYYSKFREDSLFLFNIIVCGDNEYSPNIASAISNNITLGTENSIGMNIKKIELEEKIKLNLDTPDLIYYSPWHINKISRSQFRHQNFLRVNGLSYSNLPFKITAEEVVTFFKLPIGTEETQGISLDKSVRYRRVYEGSVIDKGDIALGKLKSSSQNTICLNLENLTKHMLVVGTPGSGKTTFTLGLLVQLWKDYKKPFLVFEPAKNEYRSLINEIPELQIFTPGKNFIAPLIFNPFVIPEGVTLETYKSTLKTAFAAAVSMSSPLDKIFEETINNCYNDYMWVDTDKGSADLSNKSIFNIFDFISCFENTFDEIGYAGDAKNIKHAGKVRLENLVKLFDTYNPISIKDLLNKPTLIELTALENVEQKSLFISLLLLSILSYINSNNEEYKGDGKFKNLIVLEESHVLLDSRNQQNSGEADPSFIAKSLIKRMLAESRAYGVGLLIADQSPRKVSQDVIALTDIKIGFRLVEAEDKTIFCNSANMTEIHRERIGRLKPGEAFAFFNTLSDPEEIATFNYRDENNIPISLTDKDLSDKILANATNISIKPYPWCSLFDCCNDGCDYNTKVLSQYIAKRIFRGTVNKIKLLDIFNNLNLHTCNQLKQIKKECSQKIFNCVSIQLGRLVIYKFNTESGIKNIENYIENKHFTKEWICPKHCITQRSD